MLLNILGKVLNNHCVKSIRIWSYSGPYSVQMQENTDQNNSEYSHFSCNESPAVHFLYLLEYFISVYAKKRLQRRKLILHPPMINLAFKILPRKK